MIVSIPLIKSPFKNTSWHTFRSDNQSVNQSSSQVAQNTFGGDAEIHSTEGQQQQKTYNYNRIIYFKAYVMFEEFFCGYNTIKY